MLRVALCALVARQINLTYFRLICGKGSQTLSSLARCACSVVLYVRGYRVLVGISEILVVYCLFSLAKVEGTSVISK